jgi:hypothetical protein
MFHPENTVSGNFLFITVDEYTKGKYELIKDNPAAKYKDGTIGNILVFES